ncbi:MAG: O-antigen ligase family protein [Planctomycetota bacterium]|jgi:O-antigen ligase
MSIRVTALYAFSSIILIYALKDWFVSLCGLIFLMAFIEHEDMPKNLAGIPGLNVWNVLFLTIFVAWWTSRRNRGLTWDMPRHVNILLLMYLGVVFVGVMRVAIGGGFMGYWGLRGLITEEFINTVKWVLPGVLLFDGCRTRRQVLMVFACMFAMYFMISLQVMRRLPYSAALGEHTQAIELTRRKLPRSVGYNTGEISMMLAGAFWGIVAAFQMVRKKRYWAPILAVAGVVIFAQALSGGRGGYVAWAATGLMLCLARAKWRKYLILVPVVIVLLPIVFPGVVARMLVGFGGTDDVTGQSAVDTYALTSGRSVVWPYVIDKIGEAPMLGFGQMAMMRTDIGLRLVDEESNFVTHPHNMYLETLLDNGILGSLPMLVFYVVVVVYSTRLFRSENRLCAAVGGLALAMTLTYLISGLASGHFYPRESVLGMWASIFLMFRVYIEERRAQTVVPEVQDYAEMQADFSGACV